MVANIVGNVVEGEDFFDREEALRELREEGLRQNLLLLAPRRVGKTSLLHRLATVTREEPGWHAIYFSTEGVTDEAGFVRAFEEQLRKERAARACVRALNKGRIGRLLRGIDKVKFWPPEISRGGGADGAAELRSDLRKALSLLPDHWFILVDELPLFVLSLLRQDPSTQRARHFLQWFRNVRQREVDSVMSLHWVLAGSIGLDVIAEEHGLSDTINDLRVVRLGAFTDVKAREFLAALGERHRVPMSEAVIEATRTRAGWPIPYHLQLLFSELRALHGEHRRPPELSDVDVCFERLLGQSSYFNTWQERLPKELGAVRAGYAMTILTACARGPEGASLEVLAQKLTPAISDPEARERELRALSRILVSDGYLREDGERRAFRSNLLRAWWLRRFS